MAQCHALGCSEMSTLTLAAASCQEPSAFEEQQQGRRQKQRARMQGPGLWLSWAGRDWQSWAELVWPGPATLACGPSDGGCCSRECIAHHNLLKLEQQVSRAGGSLSCTADQPGHIKLHMQASCRHSKLLMLVSLIIDLVQQGPFRLLWP